MEASALTHASRRGLLSRRSPLLKLQGDARLIALVRDGDPGAFDTMVDRYHSRLLGFCRQMLGSTEDAEDVLQEVYVNAFRAMLADNREINLRPWLYRIARNRCLNHLRKPVADAKESMDAVPVVEAASTHERVHNREEFRQLLGDVKKLPETQRAALLLREMDVLSYEDIAQAMETTVPSVKSLLVRARISLAEASQARLLTCGEVRLELAEAAEGLCKASSPVRRHVRECADCGEFREQIRSDTKVLAALSPIGPLLALKSLLVSKLGLGGGGGATGTGASSATCASSAAGTAGAGGAGAIGAGTGAGAIGSGAAAGGLSAIGAAIGAKAVAGVVTAAVITAGAVEVRRQALTDSAAAPASPPSAIVDSPRQADTAKQLSAASVPEQAAPATEAAPAPLAAETASTPASDDPGPSVVIEEATTPAAIPQAAASVVDPLDGGAAPGTDSTSPGGKVTGNTSSGDADAPGGGGTSAGGSGESGTPGAESSTSGATAGQSGSSKLSTQTTSASVGSDDVDGSFETAPQ